MLHSSLLKLVRLWMSLQLMQMAAVATVRAIVGAQMMTHHLTKIEEDLARSVSGSLQHQAWPLIFLLVPPSLEKAFMRC
jgi:hypothetical protein